MLQYNVEVWWSSQVARLAKQLRSLMLSLAFTCNKRGLQPSVAKPNKTAGKKQNSGRSRGFHGTPLLKGCLRKYYAQMYYVHWSYAEGGMTRCYPYESTYFPMPYTDNQLLSAGFKHNSRTRFSSRLFNFCNFPQRYDLRRSEILGGMPPDPPSRRAMCALITYWNLPFQNPRSATADLDACYTVTHKQAIQMTLNWATHQYQMSSNRSQEWGPQILGAGPRLGY